VAVARRRRAGPSEARGRLTPRPPFDFGRSLAFVERFRPTDGEQVVEDGSLTKAVRVDGQTVTFRVWSTGSVEEPRLPFTLRSDRSLGRAVRASVRHVLSRYLSVDDDLRPFYELARADPTFAPRTEQLHGLHHVRFLTPFECACWSVLAQRVPMGTARRMKDALVDGYGSALEVDRRVYPAFPEPADMAGVPEADLATAIRNQRKARYVDAVSHAFSEVDRGWLESAPFEEVEAWLRGIHGIGEWSATFVMFRGLGRAGALPMTEPTLQAARRVYGARYSDDRLRRIAEGYGRWAGYWSLYLRAA
jgi:DNA-3-methyladenine glycosylase II